MTEAMREQFEADAVEAFHNAYMAARMGSPRRAGATYAAVQAVVALTLRSPAVAELVAAGDFLAMNGTDGMVRRWEAAKAAINGAKP